jgi:hypothetical protein
VFWRIEPLIGNDLETDSETTAVAMQQRGKHASATIELMLERMLCNPLLGNCNSWNTAMETGEVSMWSVPRSYLEDTLDNPVSFS